MSEASDGLAEIRSALVAVIQTQLAAWLAAGCPPTMSIDGESYDWNNWLNPKLDALAKLDAQIARRSPYYVVSRARG